MANMLRYMSWGDNGKIILWKVYFMTQEQLDKIKMISKVFYSDDGGIKDRIAIVLNALVIHINEQQEEIERLNNFMDSQCAKLLEKLGCVEKERNAAVECLKNVYTIEQVNEMFFKNN